MKYVSILVVFSFAISQPNIIAHRGYSSLAPENTLAAFQLAIDKGLKFFELDVHESKDGELIVIHDYTIDRTNSNGKTGKVNEMQSSDLTKTTAGYPKRFQEKFKSETIPTLRQVLQLSKNKINVCIEIKVEGIEEKVLNLVNELQMKNQVIIFSFKYNVLVKFRKLDSDITLLYLRSRPEVSALDYTKIIDARYIGVGNNQMITEDFIRSAHEMNLKVWVYIVNESKDIQRLTNMNIDGIISDYPERVH